MKFGELIRLRRKELGLTQMDIELKFGVSAPTVCSIENGHIPYISIAAALVVNLDISPDFATEAWAETCAKAIDEAIFRRLKK